MPTIEEKIKSADKKMTDAVERIKRDEARHKEKIRKMANKAEREAAKRNLQVETLKRKTEVAKAKASLRRAKADKSHAGVALTQAQQAHARSILSWGGLLKPSPKTRKMVKAGAKTVGKGISKWWAGIGEPKAKRNKTTSRRK